MPSLQPRERAEQARRFAHVGRFEPQVVIEIRARAMAALALAIRDPARAPADRSTRTAARRRRTTAAPAPRLSRRSRRAPRLLSGYAFQAVNCELSTGKPHAPAREPCACADHRARRTTRAASWPTTSSPPLICIVTEWPEQHRAQVRIGILAIAIGMVGIVVAIVVAARHDVFEEGLDVDFERLSAIR